MNGRNDCGAFLLCDPALGCVECMRDDDCPASANRCLGGTCTSSCTTSSSCASGATCDVDAGICASCEVDAGCTSGVCSVTTRRCVSCIAHSDCSGATPRCRVLTGTCEACTSNDDCGHSAPICDPLTFQCRVGCESDAQCPGQTCDLAKARCVDLPVDAGAITDASDAG